MHLVTIDDVPGGSAGARLASGEYLHLGRAARAGTLETWLPTTVRALLEAGHEGFNVVRGLIEHVEGTAAQQRAALVRNGVIKPPATRLLAPVPKPGLVLAAGLSYRSHLNEMSGTPAPPHPTAFMKSPTSISNPDSIVGLPPQAANAVDFEGELACVFGRVCHRVSVEQALSYVAGYTIANDISARDWVSAVWSAKAPWEARLTWEVNIMGKQLPGFTALGPVLTTCDEIADPAQLRLTTRLNGRVMQDAQVSDLIFPVAEMIAHFSRWYTFRPGDVLLTGTPAGVGVGRRPPVFIQDGDVVRIEIDRIGVLATTFNATRD